MASDYRNRDWDDDDENDRMRRPSGGGVGSSSIAYESGRRPPGRRRIILLAIVALIVGGFSAIVWNAYNQGQRSGGDGVVPLIQAENAPTKVRPEQPGGMDVPNQDKLIYDRLTPGQNPPGVERLLPPPETPVARPEPPSAPPKIESLPPEAATTAPRAPAQQPTELEAPTIATRPPTTVPSEPAQPKAESKPPAAVASIPPASSAAGGNVRIQLGAVRSKEAAQKEWARLQKANNDLLGKFSLNVSQANLGERGTFFRIQAGPVGDQQAARDLCAKLKARKVSCIIVR